MQVVGLTIGEVRPGPFTHHTGVHVKQFGNMRVEFTAELQDEDTVKFATTELRKLIAWELATKDERVAMVVPAIAESAVERAVEVKG